MTGFVYLQARPGFNPPPVDRFCPPDGRACWRSSDEASCEWVWGWGTKVGDVRLVQGDSGEFLLLSGYLAEIGGMRLPDQSRAAQVLLEKIRATPELSRLGEFTPTLSGSWAFLYRNSRTDRTIVGTDRMASRCLWSYTGQSGLALSSHPAAIATALNLNKLDLSAVAAVLLYGGPVNPCRSVFRGVWRVPPGSVCRLSVTGNAEALSWYRFQHRPQLDTTDPDWVKIAAERLTTAAARILSVEKDPIVFFSGGVDSRLTVAALVAAGGKPLLLTLGDAANIEVRVARRAAHAFGLSQQVMLRDRLVFAAIEPSRLSKWWRLCLDACAFLPGG